MAAVKERGFALLSVLWVAAILTAIGLALLASSRVAARSASEEWAALSGERLVRSGQEFASYLNSRQIGTANEDLSGLPIEPKIPGFRYTLRIPEGTVDLLLESDEGKIHLPAPDSQPLQNFLTRWTGDAASGVLMTEAIKGWIKQNNGLGVADLTSIPGFSFKDFLPQIQGTAPALTIREPLDKFLTTAAGATQVNPNFAPQLVLLSIPGLTTEQVDAIITARKQGAFFTSPEQLGIAPDSPARPYLRFDRGSLQSVLTIARTSSGRQFSERRAYQSSLRPVSVSIYRPITQLSRIEFNDVPEAFR
jgi:hypothetical protein